MAAYLLFLEDGEPPSPQAIHHPAALCAWDERPVGACSVEPSCSLLQLQSSDDFTEMIPLLSFLALAAVSDGAASREVPR